MRDRLRRYAAVVKVISGCLLSHAANIMAQPASKTAAMITENSLLAFPMKVFAIVPPALLAFRKGVFDPAALIFTDTLLF